uniref:VP1 structural protein n=1 Tax=Bat calicivirus A10 TaxID=2184710 RepID=A0A2S1ZDM9_9CALI|nr:VP1 structural protein [Bat calicivirus A10]
MMPELIGEPATGSTFSSTDASALDVPAIAGRPAATIEGPRHANVSNDDIMGYLKKQHISLQRFTWSTSQLPGTLLVNIPITPLRANNVISYLSGIFNAWNGGLEYQAKVAGTGFHAGALGIARIPPNIDPTTLKTVAQFTAFEYSVIDPKTLEAISKHIADQRPIMYHYMSNDFSDPNNIGGYFVIFVILQLNTSSTGTNQIDVEIFNKLAPDFRFIQVIPPNIPVAPITDVENGQTYSLLQFTFTLYFDFLFAMRIEAAQPFKCADGMVNLEVLSFLILHILPLILHLFWVEDIRGSLLQRQASFHLMVIMFKTLSINSHNVGANFTRILQSGVLAATSPVNFTAATVVAGAVVATNYYLNPNSSVVCTATYGSTPNIVPPAGESLVTFSYGSGLVATPFTLTTTFLAEQFLSRRYVINNNEAVLCQLFSRQTGLPVAFIKIYYNGHITSNAQVTAINLDFTDLKLEFISYTQATTPIPSLTMTMMQSLQSIRLEALLNRTRQLHLGE